MTTTESTTTLPAAIADPLRLTVNRELLRCAVGQALECPHCGHILDAQRAVCALPEGGPARIACVGCYERELWPHVAGLRAVGLAVDVLDGRVLWPPKPTPAPRAPRAKGPSAASLRRAGVRALGLELRHGGRVRESFTLRDPRDPDDAEHLAAAFQAAGLPNALQVRLFAELARRAGEGDRKLVLGRSAVRVGTTNRDWDATGTVLDRLLQEAGRHGSAR